MGCSYVILPCAVALTDASLFEYQQKVLKTLPLSVREVKGYGRDAQWRPLTPDDGHDIEGMPQSGREYFDSIDVRYYWRA
jgi:hypothetical protein